MAQPKITDVTSKLYNLLEPLDSGERQRAVRGVMALLDEPLPSGQRSLAETEEESPEENGDVSLGRRASQWLKSQGIKIEQLKELFHLDCEQVEFIGGELPGRSNREQVGQAYLVCGATALLANDRPHFDHEQARSVCEQLGCFDTTNHSKYVKALRNSIRGSKKNGWELTQPGLRAAASLIKEMVETE